MEIRVIGIDLAKNIFQVHGIDGQGRAGVDRRLRRGQVLEFFKRHPPCLVGMEAGASAHHWARELMALGHDVRLMPPQYVRPYVKTNKNDAADAVAICEAVTRPTMRFVAVKSADQQAVLMLHRVRELLLRQRTMLINALRGHLAEFGIIGARGAAQIGRLIEHLERLAADQLPALARQLVAVIISQLRDTETKLSALDQELAAWHRANGVSRRLATIPGVGPITASAIVATIEDGRHFRTARQFAAWIGLVPRQTSSGGKDRLGRISKRGDAYLRRLLVHGARAVVRWRRTDTAPSWRWLAGLVSRRPTNVATVALANKTARIAWAILTRQETYRTASTPAAALRCAAAWAPELARVTTT